MPAGTYTARDLTLEALAFIGVDTIAAASAAKLNRIRTDLNRTMQELATECPSVFKTRRAQLALAPQVGVALGVTNGSDVVTGTPGNFVNGSTIKFGADPAWNEIRLDGMAMTLLIPYGGPTATDTATIYNDVLLLDADAAELVDRPNYEGWGYLNPSPNREGLIAGRQYRAGDYGRRPYTSIPRTRLTGQPTNFWLEPNLEPGGTSLDRIRVYPLPLLQYQLSYGVRLKVYRLAAADLGTDGADSTTPLPVQGDNYEMLLRPLFLEAWSSSAWFREEDTKRSLKADALAARALIKKFAAQRRRPRTMRAF